MEPLGLVGSIPSQERFSAVRCPHPGACRTETSRCECSLHGTSRDGTTVIEHFEMHLHELYAYVNFAIVTECRWPLTLLPATAFVAPLEVFSLLGSILSKLDRFVRHRIVPPFVSDVDVPCEVGAIWPIPLQYGISCEAAVSRIVSREIYYSVVGSIRNVNLWRQIPADRRPATRIFE